MANINQWIREEERFADGGYLSIPSGVLREFLKGKVLIDRSLATLCEAAFDVLANEETLKPDPMMYGLAAKQLRLAIKESKPSKAEETA
jgi:hypothetical protein